MNHGALGSCTEALIELFWADGTLREQIVDALHRHPSVVEAWAVTGEADIIVRVRMADVHDLEQLVLELHEQGLVLRTSSSVIIRQLVEGGGPPPRRLDAPSTTQ